MILLRTIKNLCHVKKIFYPLSSQSRSQNVIIKIINNFKVESANKSNSQIQILKSSLKDINQLGLTDQEQFYKFIIYGCRVNQFSSQLIDYLKNNNYFQQMPYLCIQTILIKIQKSRYQQEIKQLFTEANEIVKVLNQSERKKSLFSIATLDRKYANFIKSNNPDQALNLSLKSIKQFQQLLQLYKKQLQDMTTTQFTNSQQVQMKLNAIKSIIRNIISNICNALIVCFNIQHEKKQYNQCQKYLKSGLNLCTTYFQNKLKPFYNLVLIKLHLELRWKYKKQNKQIITKQFKTLCQYLEEFLSKQSNEYQLLKAATYLFICRKYLHKLQDRKDIDLQKYLGLNQEYVNQIVSKHPKVQQKLKTVFLNLRNERRSNVTQK